MFLLILFIIFLCCLSIFLLLLVLVQWIISFFTKDTAKIKKYSQSDNSDNYNNYNKYSPVPHCPNKSIYLKLCLVDVFQDLYSAIICLPQIFSLSIKVYSFLYLNQWSFSLFIFTFFVYYLVWFKVDCLYYVARDYY